MFEDFENRSGFWKNLGSNYTINYSGNAPSFMSSGEMWQSMDNSETQTLAAWENGWVLMDNPDGSKTATPKYTSGLLTQTIVRVPVGPTSPNSSPMGGMGGVVVFNAGTEATSDYTGPFVIIRALGDGLKIYNEDGTQYSKPGWVAQTYGTTAETREEAIADAVAYIPNGIYYKVEDGGSGKWKTDIIIDWETVCPSENRELNDIFTHGDVKIGQKCGNCLSGYVEDDTGTCIAEEIDTVGETEEGSNWPMYAAVGGIAVLALVL